MIYDRVLTIYTLDNAASPLTRRLRDPVGHYYAEREVFYNRYVANQQIGVRVNMMAELPRAEDEARITENQYCIPEDGGVYRVTQAQYGYDEDGLPITTLSLMRMEGKYELFKT